MSLQDKIRDRLIKEVINGMVRRANEKYDMKEVLDKYNATGRTMSIVISDLDDGYGFNVKDGKLTLEDIVSPTCVISMNKATFSAIATNKITNTQAFLMDSVKVVGDNWLRDALVVNKIFDELKGTMLKRDS